MTYDDYEDEMFDYDNLTAEYDYEDYDEDEDWGNYDEEDREYDWFDGDDL